MAAFGLEHETMLTHVASRARPALLVAMMLASTAAFAQKAPTATEQEVLVKSSLSTFNDANVTGNYTVLHAKLSKPFRDQFTPDKLKETFKEFSDKHIDFDVVVAKPVTFTGDVKVDDEGVLKLDGYVAVTDERKVNFNLKFVRSEGEWKLIGLNVKL